MNIRVRVGYFFAGMLFTNSMPHLAIGLTGRRNITPLQRDSSSGVNVLWGLCNFGAGYGVLHWMDRKAGVRPDSHEWLLALLSGSLDWSLFMVIVEASEFTHQQP
jgi:hypothetical protein